MFFSRRKKLSPSNLPPTDGVIEQSAQQMPSPSESQSPDLYPWSVNPLPQNLLSKDAPPSGPLPSPFPRYGPALPATPTAAGELFLFGGLVRESESNDLYVFSTVDLSATLLQISGDVPSPRVGHAAALANDVLLIWGGDTSVGRQEALNEPPDDSLYLLNLGTLGLFLSIQSPADESFLHSSIARMDSRRDQWFRASRSLWPRHDGGRFQAICIWWSDQWGVPE